MSLISINNLTFCYEGSYDNIFQNVSFSMDSDWRLGFTGRNGRGKTTFLKLLMGEYDYSGKINANVSFDYFPFEVINASRITREVLAQICGGEDWQFERELNLLEVAINVLDRPFNSLSPGEQTKVKIIGLFLKENNFLLIDEPTNHLDVGARRILSEYLVKKKGFILVSHDRVFLDKCVDHVLSINRSDIAVQKGNFSSWLENKDRQDNFERDENEKLAGDIKRLGEASRRAAGWSDKIESGKYGSLNSGLKVDKGYIGHKSAKMMKQAKVIENRQNKAIEEKSKLLKNIESADALKIHPLIYGNKSLIDVKNLCIRYGDNTVTENVSFTLEQGDRMALIGKNGCGKSSIIKLLLGENIDYSGNVNIAGGIKISFITQDISYLKGSLKEFCMDYNLDESLFKAILRKLDLGKIQFDKNIEQYSGGQKKKVLLAKSLCERAHIYIWDEPLNFIDVISRMQIQDLILKYKPTMIFVEHDIAFCGAIATKQVLPEK